MVRIAEDAGYDFDLLKGVVTVNDEQLHRVATKIIDLAGGSVEGKRIAVWGLTFKARTDDLRESPSLTVIEHLVARGATVRAFDPSGPGPLDGRRGRRRPVRGGGGRRGARRAHRVGRVPLARPRQGRRPHGQPQRGGRPQPARPGLAGAAGLRVPGHRAQLTAAAGTVPPVLLTPRYGDRPVLTVAVRTTPRTRS